MGRRYTGGEGGHGRGGGGGGVKKEGMKLGRICDTFIGKWALKEVGRGEVGKKGGLLFSYISYFFTLFVA